MIVVSDTSPVLNLARVGRLQLLALLYRQVLISSAVYDELTASTSDLPPARPFRKPHQFAFRYFRHTKSVPAGIVYSTGRILNVDGGFSLRSL